MRSTRYLAILPFCVRSDFMIYGQWRECGMMQCEYDVCGIFLSLTVVSEAVCLRLDKLIIC